jgi:RimJ/RimL family protein N-acetyltransferase
MSQGGRLLGTASGLLESPVRLEPWGLDDLPLLLSLMGDAEMMAHLGGAESPEQIARRHARYLQDWQSADSGTGLMFKMVAPLTGQAVGSVGYWEREWRGQWVYETGWAVLAKFQGQGYASLATARVIEIARSEDRHPYLHAFPSVDNKPSNAVCRKLRFALLGASQFEYPPGRFMRCNDWRLDLKTSVSAPG